MSIVIKTVVCLSVCTSVRCRLISSRCLVLRSFVERKLSSTYDVLSTHQISYVYPSHCNTHLRSHWRIQTPQLGATLPSLLLPYTPFSFFPLPLPSAPFPLK